MMRGLMMDAPLMIADILAHADRNHGRTEIVSREIDGGIFRYTYAEAHTRARKLAQALIRLGVEPGDRVATLAWNTRRHFEMFFGVSGIGALLHTINPRLFRDQLVYIANHCEDSWLFCDPDTLTLAEDLAPDLKTIKGYCLMAGRDEMPEHSSLAPLLCYEDLIAAEDGDFDWPAFDEQAASSICYTSGTTGNPKGVVYSHRSTVLSSITLAMADSLPGGANGQLESVLLLSPMFHGNGWDMRYIAPILGARLVLPGRSYDPADLTELLVAEKVTVVVGVPTFWLLLLPYLEETGTELPHLRLALSSGNHPPRWMVEKLRHRFGVDLANTWGMTEALGASRGTLKPGDADLDEDAILDRMMKAGRGTFGAQLRVVDDAGRPLPHDGRTLGHLQAKGAWIAAGYFKNEGGPLLTADGWMPTGDIAVIDEDGRIELRDRSKDVIKSGGEWISSTEIEGLVLAHPAVAQAAVIAVPHPRWQERPLLICQLKPGAQAGKPEILGFLEGKVAPWWLPDDVVFIDKMPMTATGKVQKYRLRERFHDYRLPEKPGRTKPADA